MLAVGERLGEHRWIRDARQQQQIEDRHLVERRIVGEDAGEQAEVDRLPAHARVGRVGEVSRGRQTGVGVRHGSCLGDGDEPRGPGDRRGEVMDQNTPVGLDGRGVGDRHVRGVVVGAARLGEVADRDGHREAGRILGRDADGLQRREDESVCTGSDCGGRGLDSGFHCRRSNCPVEVVRRLQRDHERVRAAVLEELKHRAPDVVRQVRAREEPTECGLVVGEAEQLDRLCAERWRGSVRQLEERTREPDEHRHGGRRRRHRVARARELLDVDAWVTHCHGHLRLLSAHRRTTAGIASP